MRSRFAAAALAALLVLSPFAVNAQQDQAQQQQPSELQRIIGGIGRASFAAAARAARSTPNISIVRLSSFPDAKAQRNYLVQIETLRLDAISALQGQVANNPVATKAIQDGKFFITQVVSARRQDDGSVVLYVDDL